MSNVITLDSIREKIEAKYAATEIRLSQTEIVKLRNPLRLPKAERARLLNLDEELDGVKGDIDAQLELIEEIIEIAADPKHTPGRRLVEEVGNDAAMLLEIVDSYLGEQELGEASTSES